MFLRLVADSFGRRPRHKLLTGAALAQWQADSLPLEIGGVDYRPVNAGAYLPEADLPKLKTIFWHNNIMGFAPILETTANLTTKPETLKSSSEATKAQLIGTWASHPIVLSDGATFTTGIEKTNPWFRIQGRWFSPDAGGLRRVNHPLLPGAGASHIYVSKPEECAIGVNLAKRMGLQEGAQVYVNVPNSEKMQMYAPCAVTGILSTGGAEDDAVLMPLSRVQQLANHIGEYRKLYVSALTKPEDAFARKDPKTMTPVEFDRWYCTPYISSIALQIQQELPGTDVRVIRRVAEGEGQILTRVQMLLWLVTAAAMLAAALAVGASSAASVIERQVEIGLMKALGAGSGTVGFLLAAEQLLLAFVGGGVGYALGIVLARLLGERIFGAAPEPTLLVFFVVIGLAALVTLLGSAIPLRRASRIEPAPILRGE